MNRYEWLDAYLLEKAGAVKDYKAEWGWDRYLLGGRMFAAVCTPDPKHEPHNGRTMVMLKCEPELCRLFRAKYPDVVPGFYCNKDNWNSVYLDGAVPDEVLRGMCDASYALIMAKLPKRVQRELTGVR